MTTERKLTTAFLAVLVVLVANTVVSFRKIGDMTEMGRLVDHPQGVLVAVSDLDSTIRDADLSHRSYLLTGSKGWHDLENKAIAVIVPAQLRDGPADDRRQPPPAGIDGPATGRRWRPARLRPAPRGPRPARRGSIADPVGAIGREVR